MSRSTIRRTLVVLIASMGLAFSFKLVMTRPYRVSPKEFRAQLSGIRPGMTRREVFWAMHAFDRVTVTKEHVRFFLIPTSRGLAPWNLKYAIVVNFDDSGHVTGAEYADY